LTFSLSLSGELTAGLTRVFAATGTGAADDAAAADDDHDDDDDEVATAAAFLPGGVSGSPERILLMLVAAATRRLGVLTVSVQSRALSSGERCAGRQRTVDRHFGVVF